MSLIISAYNQCGIVLGSDSFTTVSKESGKGIINNTNKCYLYNNKIGVLHCGDAHIDNKTIDFYLREFEKKVPSLELASFINELRKYFIMLSEDANIDFIICGYIGNDQYIYGFNTKQSDIEIIQNPKPGARFSGVTHIVCRLVKDVFDEKGRVSYNGYNFEWGLYNLQNLIDITYFLIKTTEKVFELSASFVPVGGEVDILIITPEEAKWIKKKELKCDELLEITDNRINKL